MTDFPKNTAKRPRKLGIQQELHAATGSSRFTLLMRAA